MPIDTFAALNAMLRAEAARAEVTEPRRASAVVGRDTEPVAAAEDGTTEAERNESGTTQ
ncbi:hypothetical protein ACIOJD_18020 [Streptomyces sp. NPDC088116]|uniref:hypothetical protein n=1 Tax=Streptomyces sp. NPDC088116 TaxID=3365825 RepID=UPI00382D7BFD